MSSPTGLSIIQGFSASVLEFSVSGFVVCVPHEIDLLCFWPIWHAHFNHKLASNSLANTFVIKRLGVPPSVVNMSVA